MGNSENYCGAIPFRLLYSHSRRSDTNDGNEKIVWIVIIAVTHWIGALIYFIVRRPERMRLYGR